MFDQMAGLHAHETSSLKELQKMDENFRKVAYNAFRCQYDGKIYFQDLESGTIL